MNFTISFDRVHPYLQLVVSIERLLFFYVMFRIDFDPELITIIYLTLSPLCHYSIICSRSYGFIQMFLTI